MKTFKTFLNLILIIFFLFRLTAEHFNPPVSRVRAYSTRYFKGIDLCRTIVHFARIIILFVFSVVFIFCYKP